MPLLICIECSMGECVCVCDQTSNSIQMHISILQWLSRCDFQRSSMLHYHLGIVEYCISEHSMMNQLTKLVNSYRLTDVKENDKSSLDKLLRSINYIDIWMTIDDSGAVIIWCNGVSKPILPSVRLLKTQFPKRLHEMGIACVCVWVRYNFCNFEMACSR